MARKKKRVIFSKKKVFEQSYTIFDTEKDFKLGSQHQFAMAADPSRDTLIGLIDVMGKAFTVNDIDSELTEQEVDDINDEFFDIVSQVILDCDIVGMSFDNGKEAEKSMNAGHVDWHFMFGVLGAYIQHLLTTHEALGKVLTLPEDSSDSGEEE